MPEAASGSPSKYEAQAWADLQRFKPRPMTRGVRAVSDVTVKGARAAGNGARAAGRQIERLVDGHPNLERARDAVGSAAHAVSGVVPDNVSEKAAGWGRSATASLDRVVASVARAGLSPEKVVLKHRKAGHDVETLADLRSLDLALIDKVRPRKSRFTYPGTAAASGAVTSFVITGGEIIVTASGGVASAPGGTAIAGAMALDVATVVGLMSRAVGQQALSYGYDPEDPAEKLFILSVVNAGTALSGGAKLAAMADVSRLTQQLVRGATWTKLLDSSLLARLYKQVLARFAVRTTKQGLGKLVPVVGILISGGFNWATLEQLSLIHI